MQKIKHLFLFIGLFQGLSSLNAQMKIGSNSTTLNTNSIFEMEHTSKGMLLPRLALSSSTSATPLTAHVQGMVAYNTATAGDVTPGFFYNDGTKWVRMMGGAGQGALSTTAGPLVTISNGAGATLTAMSVSVDTTALKTFVSNNISSGGITGKNTVAGSLITVTNGIGATLTNMTVAIDTNAMKTFISSNSTGSVTGQNLTGNGIIVTNGTGATLTTASLRLDSTVIAKMIGQSPIKDSISSTVSTQIQSGSVTGQNLTAGSLLQTTGTPTGASLKVAGYQVDTTALKSFVANNVGKSPIKDSISSTVSTQIQSGSVTGQNLTAGSLLQTTGTPTGASLKAAGYQVDTTALKTFVANNVGKSPIKDSISSTVSTQIQSGSVTGQDLTGVGIIVVNGIGTTLKATKLYLDTLAIAGMIGKSPIKDSVSSTMMTLIQSGNVTGQNLTAGTLLQTTGTPTGASLKAAGYQVDTTSLKSFVANNMGKSPIKDSVSSTVTTLIQSGNVTGQNTTAGSLVIVTNGTGAALKNNSVSVDTTALKSFIANNVNKSPIGDSIGNSVTNLINQNKVAGKALTNGNGIIVTGGDSAALKATSLRLDSTAIAKMIGQSPVKDSIAKLVTSSPIKDSIASVEPWYNVVTGKGATKNTDSIYTMGKVAIGTSTPNKSAILDVSSSDKGVLLPSINITSPTLQIGSSPNALGLLIFNSGSVLPKGYYFWNGIEWRTIDNSTAMAPNVSSINCSGAELIPSSYSAGTAYTGTLLVPYTGGNAAPYIGGDSITVNGLKFKLQGGKLSSGSGNFIFDVTGTPTVSSPTSTDITMNSSLLTFYTGSACTVSVGNTTIGTIKSVAAIGSPTLMTDGGVTGYGLSVTSADGVFSVRAFIVSNDYDAASATFGTDNPLGINLQIRYNGTIDTPIAGEFNWFWGGVGGAAYDNLYLKAGQWCGGNEFTTTSRYASYVSSTGSVGNSGCYSSGASYTPCRYVSWGDPGVQAAGVPERREYSWTINNGAIKSAYILRFSSSSSIHTQLANTTNCPGGVCPKHKFFMVIEQINSN